MRTVCDWRTEVMCVRIEPISAPIVRLTAHPVDLTMSNGQVYLTENGYEFSGIDSTTTFASASIDISGILRMGAIQREDLLSGKYDNARVYLFSTSWKNPIEDEERCGLYFFGRVECRDDTYTVQLMGAIDVLSQTVGHTYSPTCPWTLFDQGLGTDIIDWHHSRCSGPRSAPDGPTMAANIVTGSLTSVISQYEFSDSSRSEADGWFAYGQIQFTSGNNAGTAPIQVKTFASGAIELHDATLFIPQIGDSYQMIPGCAKTASACKDKWSNKRNFGGFDRVPTGTQYSQRGRK